MNKKGWFEIHDDERGHTFKIVIYAYEHQQQDDDLYSPEATFYVEQMDAEDGDIYYQVDDMKISYLARESMFDDVLAAVKEIDEQSLNVCQVSHILQICSKYFDEGRSVYLEQKKKSL